MWFERYIRWWFLLVLTFVVCHRPLYSKDWLVSPSLRVGEVYTDNLNLTSDKQGAFVSEFSPSITVRKNSNRTKLNLNYRLQNLFNASSGQDKIYNMLNANASMQIVKNSVYVDTRASISQQNINSAVQSTSNISNPLNRTTVSTYGISPYWTPHFNGYAKGNIRFNIDQMDIASGAASNAFITEEIINLTSDTRFHNNISWRLAFFNHDESRAGTGSVKYQNTEAETRLRINKTTSLFALVGNSNNSYQTLSNTISNGAYYTVGASWRPVREFSVEAGYGINSYVTMGLLPMRNMSWVTTFRNRAVGNNIGNTWQTNLNFYTKLSNLNISYLEDTSSTQSALLGQVYSAQNIYQQQPIDQIYSSINYNIPSLTNQVYIRKRANVAFSYRTGKSLLSSAVYDERRIFQGANYNQEVTGVLAAWNWQVAHLMSVFISPLWQHTNDNISSSFRHDIAVGLIRSIPINFEHKNGGMNAYLEYRHSNQTSNLITNSFDENRLTANLQITF